MKKINELVTSTEKPEHKAKRKAITFGSFKRAEERQIAERKEREHQQELALIAEQARIERELAEEEQRVIREENKRKRGEFITESMSNAFNTKTDVDFKPVREKVIDKYLPQLKEQETLDDYPKPFEAEPALNRELAEFKKKINEHLHKVGFASGGGGGIGDIGDAGDVDATTAKVNGKFLKFDSSTQKFVGADASSSGATAADDISAGDAAVNITTTSGNITIDAAANNSDIIFKGTDGGSDTTFLTIDGSAAGAATFNDKIVATELDISGDVDVDGTLEADAITVNGTTLTETIQDTVGAMFSSNTETGIAVSYEDGDGTIDLVVGTLNQDTTGNAATATALETARNIGGVSFDGTGNINLPGVNTSGNQDTSGNAATATALETARTIGGVSFDGSANINLPGVNTAGNQDTSGTAAVATTVTITDNESTDEDNAIVFTAGGDVDGGNLGLESDGTLTYNPSTGKITATGFIGDVTGNVSGTAATVTGAAQSNITSLGTLTTLTVDSIIINGTNIGHTSDTDAIDIASDGKTTFSQNIIAEGDIEIGHASDTTLARSSSGNLSIEGNLIYRAGGTDVPVADGGTGASSLTDGGILLGSGTDAITAMSALAKGSIVAGDGATDPVELAVGANDTVLTADSSEASGLKWAAASGGSGYELLSATTASNTSLVSLETMESGYNYRIIASNLVPASNNQDLHIQVGTSGPSYATSGYQYIVGGFLGTSLTKETSTSASAFRVLGQGGGTATGEQIFCDIHILNPATNERTMLYGNVGGKVHDGNMLEQNFVGFRSTAEVNTAVKIFFASANISTGNIFIYRLKAS